MAFGCLSCEKDDAFSMNPENLSGTYWKKTERCRCYIEDGKYQSDGNMLGEDWVGAAAPTVLYFQDDQTVVEYLSFAPTGVFIHNSYKISSFIYDREWRMVKTDMHMFSNTDLVTVEKLTSGKMVLSSIYNDPNCGIAKKKHVYLRWTTEEAWKQRVATWPNNDDIDWP